MLDEVVTEHAAVGVVEPQPLKKKRGRKPKDPTKAGRWSGKTKGSEEYKQLDRELAAERRELRKDERDQASREIGCETNLFKKDIKRILIEERKIRPLLAEQIVPLIQVAARAHAIPANWYLVRHGLKNTLAKTELGQIEEGVLIGGEILYRHELECIYDFSLFRQPGTSFDEFLAIRRNCKTDVMFLAKLIGKDFHNSPHGKWTYEFFPRFNPDGLRPNYTQQEARHWVAQQIDHYNTFLLLASRNAYKSTWAQVFVMTFVLCYPDALVILASETHDLSENLIGGLRQYFEVLDESTPDKLLQFFPEYAVPAGEGSSMVYECPIRHLRLPAPTIRSISLDSAVAGGRFNLLVADDVLSDKSSGNEKQTKATTSRFDSLQKLGQANSSLTVVLGTPWSETPPDLYKTLKDRAESDPDTKIAVRIDPIMQIKPQALKKKLTDLVETDIESLLFPEVLDWNFIRAEIMKNPKDTTFFESQNLVRFVPPAESKYKCNFEEQVLRNLIVYPAMFSQWTLLRSILSVDTSASASRYADMSALVLSPTTMPFRISRYVLEKNKKIFLQDIGPSYSTREQAEDKLEQIRRVFRFTDFTFEVREVQPMPSTLDAEIASFDESEYRQLEKLYASGELLNPWDFRRLSYLRAVREVNTAPNNPTLSSKKVGPQHQCPSSKRSLGQAQLGKTRTNLQTEVLFFALSGAREKQTWA